jgi:hypothetical protein
VELAGVELAGMELAGEEAAVRGVVVVWSSPPPPPQAAKPAQPKNIDKQSLRRVMGNFLSLLKSCCVGKNQAQELMNAKKCSEEGSGKGHEKRDVAAAEV